MRKNMRRMRTRSETQNAQRDSRVCYILTALGMCVSCVLLVRYMPGARAHTGTRRRAVAFEDTAQNEDNMYTGIMWTVAGVCVLSVGLVGLYSMGVKKAHKPTLPQVSHPPLMPWGAQPYHSR